MSAQAGKETSYYERMPSWSEPMNLENIDNLNGSSLHRFNSASCVACDAPQLCKQL